VIFRLTGFAGFVGQEAGADKVPLRRESFDAFETEVLEIGESFFCHTLW
jgi:hypothetical protein